MSPVRAQSHRVSFTAPALTSDPVGRGGYKRSLNTRGVPTSTDTLARFLRGPLWPVCVCGRDFLWYRCVNKPERYRKAGARASGGFVCVMQKKINMKSFAPLKGGKKGKYRGNVCIYREIRVKQRPVGRASDQ